MRPWSDSFPGRAAEKKKSSRFGTSVRERPQRLEDRRREMHLAPHDESTQGTEREARLGECTSERRLADLSSAEQSDDRGVPE
jgi:hypothetical protein